MSRNVIKYILVLSAIFLFFSCNQKQNEITNTYVENNFKKYEGIYKILNDSINLYQDSLIKEFLFIYGEDWKLDSMICINSINDHLVAAINVSYGKGKEGTTDDISKILGKKIKNKWYFFMGGGNLVIPRNMYGKDEMHPLSFHELSQIARKEFLESALIKNGNGEFVVNDKWVDAHFTDLGWGKFKNVAQYDSVHWYYIMHKWQEKIDTNKYKPLWRNKGESPAL